MKDEEVRTFEVKSRKEAYFEPTTRRQILLPIGIHHYIKRDVFRGPVKIPGYEEVAKGMVRLESGYKEDWHDRVAGAIFKSLRKNRVAEVRIGEKRYFAAPRTRSDELRRTLEKLTESDHWVIGNTQKRVEGLFDLPPFTRWFKPDSAVEIISGQMIILSAFSLEDLVQLFHDKGVTATYKLKRQDLFPINLSTPFVEEQKKTVEYIGNIGDWQRQRVLYSFLALESFVEICTFMISREANEQAKSMLGPSRKHDTAESGAGPNAFPSQ